MNEESSLGASHFNSVNRTIEEDLCLLSPDVSAVCADILSVLRGNITTQPLVGGDLSALVDGKCFSF